MNIGRTFPYLAVSWQISVGALHKLMLFMLDASLSIYHLVYPSIRLSSKFI